MNQQMQSGIQNAEFKITYQSALNILVNIVIPAKARDYVFTSVGLSVCLFVTMITK